jgi:DNA-binding response OmpR family regulator
MSGLTTKLQIHFLNPDESLLAGAETLRHPAIHFQLPSAPAASLPIPLDAQVVVVSVDTALGLELVKLARRQAGGRPVIAMAGQGHARKSLEHILVLAELRGAAATLVRPFDAHDLAVSAMAVWSRFGHVSEVKEPSCKVS